MTEEAKRHLVEALRLLAKAALGGGDYKLRNDEPKRLTAAIDAFERELLADKPSVGLVQVPRRPR